MNAKKGCPITVAITLFSLLTVTILLPPLYGKPVTTDTTDSNEFESIKSVINASLLDLRYIHNLTENLSYIIFNAYDEEHGDIAQGRAFGTKGEHLAAKILIENMTKLGLYVHKEKINSTLVTLADVSDLAAKIEILERGLTVHNLATNATTTITDYYIGTVNNFTGFGSTRQSVNNKIKSRWPLIGPPITTLLDLIPPYHHGFLDTKHNIYEPNQLTYNLSYTNLAVLPKPTNYSLFRDMLRHYHNKDPFVYIANDTTFSPWPKHPATFTGLIYKFINKTFPDSEMILWRLFQPNCHGVILFDYGNDTFNTGDGGPLPIIHINRTIGAQIYANPQNYRIDFSLSQRWNDSVESYNVIGQLNSSVNSNKTVVISCLYDSTWCQGTADSAIGMAMVLGIAKYFHDHNDTIHPNCTIQFVGFCGEEAGMRGAYFYEANHRNDHITTVIDLNQLGFHQVTPRLTLRIFTNNQSLNSTISTIANRTQYVERTGNITDFRTTMRENGGPESNAYVFARANIDFRTHLYNTILFVKIFKWPFHHRDGQNHTKGDVMTAFDWKDTSITGEMVWNVTKHITVDCP